MLMTGVERSKLFTEDVQETIEQALGEALANAVEHGIGENCFVSAQFNKNEMVVEITNKTSGCLSFCDQHVKPQTFKTDMLETAERGRGILIIYAIMDEVVMSCDTEQVSITMTKRRDTPAYHHTIDEIRPESITCVHTQSVMEHVAGEFPEEVMHGHKGSFHAIIYHVRKWIHQLLRGER
jgi:anti-sigma regulatory factor (Ser/Thr protein kinase)